MFRTASPLNGGLAGIGFWRSTAPWARRTSLSLQRIWPHGSRSPPSCSSGNRRRFTSHHSGLNRCVSTGAASFPTPTPARRGQFFHRPRPWEDTERVPGNGKVCCVFLPKSASWARSIRTRLARCRSSSSILDHDVVPRAAVQDIQAGAAEQGVVAIAAIEHIPSSAADQDIVIVATLGGETDDASEQS